MYIIQKDAAGLAQWMCCSAVRSVTEPSYRPCRPIALVPVGSYSVVYVHSAATSDNLPSVDWLRSVRPHCAVVHHERCLPCIRPPPLVLRTLCRTLACIRPRCAAPVRSPRTKPHTHTRALMHTLHLYASTLDTCTRTCTRGGSARSGSA